jgi:predicted dehydrogenase
MFLLDMGCHHFDAIRYVLGADPLSARVLSWNLPWGWHAGDASHVALFDFPGRVRAIQRATGCSNGKATPWSGDWRIEGPRGSITWEDGRVFVTREHRTENRRREEIPLEAAGGKEGQAAVLDEFLAALRDDREPECSSRDNLGTMAMTFAAVESARSGRAVALSEVG